MTTRKHIFEKSVQVQVHPPLHPPRGAHDHESRFGNLPTRLIQNVFKKNLLLRSLCFDGILKNS